MVFGGLFVRDVEALTIEEMIPDKSFRACLTELVKNGSSSRYNEYGELINVQYTLNGEEFDKLTPDVLDKIIYVDCTFATSSMAEGDIKDITGVSYLSNLKTLYLNYLDIDSISLDSSKNTKLSEIYLVDTKYKSLKLEGFEEKLEALDVSNKNLSLDKVTEYINKYPNLKSLGIRGIPSSTMVDLSSLTKLEKLEISSNNFKVYDEEKIKNLSFLVSDVSQLDLSKFTNLERLDVCNTKLASIDLSHNTKLNSFFAASTNIKSFNFGSNDKLTMLWIDYASLNNINFSQIPNLDHLGVTFFKIVPVYGETLTKEQITSYIPDSIAKNITTSYSHIPNSINGKLGKSELFSISEVMNSPVAAYTKKIEVEGDIEFRFMELTSDKYVVDQKNSTIDVGTDDDATIKNHLKLSWDGGDFRIEGEQLKVYYNGMMIKEFRLKRIVNPQTGSFTIYIVMGIMFISICTFFGIRTMNKINNVSKI